MLIQYSSAYHPAPWFVQCFEGVFHFPAFAEAQDAYPDADLDLPAMSKLLEEVLS